MPPCLESAQITPPPPVAAAVAWDTADAAMAPSTDGSTWQMCQAVFRGAEARNAFSRAPGAPDHPRYDGLGRIDTRSSLDS